MRGGSAGTSFLKPFFRALGKRFPKFPYKIFVIVLLDIIGLKKNSDFLSTNHNPELRCVILICISVRLFAPVLHMNWTALSQSESKFFFMYVISFVISWLLL